MEWLFLRRRQALQCCTRGREEHRRQALHAGIRIRRPVPSLAPSLHMHIEFSIVLVAFNIDLTPQPIFASGWSLPSIGHLPSGKIPRPIRSHSRQLSCPMGSTGSSFLLHSVSALALHTEHQSPCSSDPVTSHIPFLFLNYYSTPSSRTHSPTARTLPYQGQGPGLR